MNDYYSDSTDRRIIPIIRIGEVVNNLDPKRAGLIRARITGIDKLESNDSLIDCVPLLPRFITTMPKVGESVFIFQYEDEKSDPTSKFNSKRFWLGPIISQPTKLDYDPAAESNAVLPDGWTRLKDPAIQEGAYGDPEDIVFQGRYNTDIVQKDRQIWLRSGKFIEGANTEFNSTDLGYIQLRYGGDKLKKVLEDKEIVTQTLPQPNILITAKITTFTTAGKALPPDLPSEDYKKDNIGKTIIDIKVKDLTTNDIITSLNKTIGEGNILIPDLTITPKSHEDAIKEAKEFIDSNKGEKWKLKSQSPDLLNQFPNAKDGTAIFSITPIEDKKKIKEVKFVANDVKTSSVINMVANKINLLSHDGEHTFELANPKKLITDEEQEIINNEAHPLVYGDTLVEFLELVKNFVNLHVHPYHGMPPDPGPTKLDVLRFDLNTILNHNINSN